MLKLVLCHLTPKAMQQKALQIRTIKGSSDAWTPQCRLQKHARKMARLIAVATLIAVFGLINGQIETIANLLSPQAPGRNSCNARFDVRVSSPSPMRGLLGDRLNFQDAQINEGGWDGVNHEFRAPCKGLYYFHFEARAPARGEFILSLMQNYQNQVATHGGEGGDLIGSNSALLLLDQGEIVHLELQGKLEQRHTSFSGILVERL